MHDLSRDLLLVGKQKEGRRKKDDSMGIGAADDDSVGRGDERESGIHRHAHMSAVIVQLKAKGTEKKRRERRAKKRKSFVFCSVMYSDLEREKARREVKKERREKERETSLNDTRTHAHSKEW